MFYSEPRFHKRTRRPPAWGLPPSQPPSCPQGSPTFHSLARWPHTHWASTDSTRLHVTRGLPSTSAMGRPRGDQELWGRHCPVIWRVARWPKETSKEHCPWAPGYMSTLLHISLIFPSILPSPYFFISRHWHRRFSLTKEKQRDDSTKLSQFLKEHFFIHKTYFPSIF